MTSFGRSVAALLACVAPAMAQEPVTGGQGGGGVLVPGPRGSGTIVGGPNSGATVMPLPGGGGAVVGGRGNGGVLIPMPGGGYFLGGGRTSEPPP